ncbi:cupin domain-containing protein [Actinospica robiniae]|uniref:cupin domain-containing protein n=1 Tax=Actinospica robiniae TaxID=304901 RepID=UPI0003FF8D94|nr:cupin domain-containing protein [Actinospica robiniae]
MTAPDFTALRLADGVLAPADANVVLAEWIAEGASGEEPLYQAPLHRHEEDEAWYVLEGSLCVRIGEQVSEISAGGAVIVPGGIAHTYWNPAPDPARYLLVMGARTYALIQAIHAAEDRSPDALRRLFREYGAELLDG